MGFCLSSAIRTSFHLRRCTAPVWKTEFLFRFRRSDVVTHLDPARYRPIRRTQNRNSLHAREHRETAGNRRTARRRGGGSSCHARCISTTGTIRCFQAVLEIPTREFSTARRTTIPPPRCPEAVGLDLLLHLFCSLISRRQMTMPVLSAVHIAIPTVGSVSHANASRTSSRVQLT